jgi:hypothetical protein
VKILVMVFGAFAAIDGFALIATSLSWKEHHEDWGLLLVAGIGIAGLGIISFLRPGITELLLLALIAARFMISGMTEIIMAVRLRKQIEGEWMLMVDGALSFMIGLVLTRFARLGRGCSSDAAKRQAALRGPTPRLQQATAERRPSLVACRHPTRCCRPATL